MKSFHSIFLSILTLLVVCSCSGDSALHEQKITFDAVYSLTAIDSIPQVWSVGSRIAVSGASEAFKATDRTIPEHAQFSGKAVHAERYHALSPYSAFRSFKPSCPSEISAELPVIQTAVRGAIPREANIAAASCAGEDEIMRFSHLMSFIKFTIGPDSGKIRSVSAMSTDGSRISGNFSVDCFDPYLAVYPSSGSYSNAVLEAPGDYLEEGDYYLAVFPMSSEAIVDLAFEDVEGKVALSDRSCPVGRVAGSVSDYGTVTGLDFRNWDILPVASTKRMYQNTECTIELQFHSRVDATAYVQPGVDWISIIMTKEVGLNSLIITLEENTGEIRVGQVIVESADGKSRIIYTFTQFGNPSSYEERYRSALIDLYNTAGGEGWRRNDNWCSDLPLKDWYGVHTDADGAFVSLSLIGNGLSGTLPDSFGDLASNGAIYLSNNALTGVIPSSLYRLYYVDLSDNVFTGIEDVDNPSVSPMRRLDVSGNRISGELPAEIGRLPMLEYLDLSDNLFSGAIPSSYGDMNMNSLFLNGNMLTGKFPPSMLDNDYFDYYWPQIIVQKGGGLDFEGVDLFMPEFLCYDQEKNPYVSSEVFSENELTLIYTWSEGDDEFLERLGMWYDAYHEDGFEVIISYARPDDRPYLYAYSTSSYEFLEKPSYVVLADNKGKIIVNPLIHDRNEVFDVLIERFGYKEVPDNDSHDDGDVLVLQKASEGNGIDIVITGEAYTAEQIESEMYAESASAVMEYFFSVEPFRSCRHLFNVYSVTAVSDDGIIGAGNDTKFDCELAGDSKFKGNDSRCFEYALKAVSEERLEETLVIVLVNTSYYAGTSYLYPPDSGDFGNGKAVSYLSAEGTPYLVERLVHHEAAGHGFAKLADEYVVSSGGIPSGKVAEYRMNEKYGWWRNCDFTDDISKVKWAHIASDSRYASQSVNVYEGALGYSKGVWRPTRNSIMNDNTGAFNAPSREAVWRRMMKLAYGSSWKYSYEDFVEFDTAPARSSSRSYEMLSEECLPLPSPVVVAD